MIRVLHFFRKKPCVSENGSEPKKDKRYLIALLLLAAFVGFSLVSSIRGGGLQKMILGFRFHYSDIALTIALAAAYLIYRIRGRGNHD